MAGSLAGTPERDEFFEYLKNHGLKANSASSYISYINTLCTNMAAAHTQGANEDTALDVLMRMARSSTYEDDYLRALQDPVQGPKGRFGDLHSAAKQFFQYARNTAKAGAEYAAAPIASKPAAALAREDQTPPSVERNAETPAEARKFVFHKVQWLRNPPDETFIKAVDEFLELLAIATPGSLINAKEKEFDEGIRQALKTVGCLAVSELDSQKVFPGAEYTYDITATTPEGIRLLIEIEKTEVKRVLHDILKIAAGQRRDPKAVGLILVPDRYRTDKQDYPRTHLQEAKAVMELIDYSHPWAGQAIGVVVYEA